MRKLALISFAAAIFGAVTAAEAGSFSRPCTTEPQSQWLSLETLQAKVETRGFKVQKAKLKNACGEFYALDKNGARIELFVDPVTGEIAGQL